MTKAAKAAASGSNGHVELDAQLIPIEGTRTAFTGQHRRDFEPASLQELADSIKSQGILQPLLLRPAVVKDWKPWQHDHGKQGLRWDVRALDPEEHIVHHGYETKAEAQRECDRLRLPEIVAGERRWRAAKMAGLTHVPCVVREMTASAARHRPQGVSIPAEEWPHD